MFEGLKEAVGWMDRIEDFKAIIGPKLKKGIEILEGRPLSREALEIMRDNGEWHVEDRAHPQQTYFTWKGIEILRFFTYLRRDKRIGIRIVSRTNTNR